jgi:hypothetical protein
VLQFKLVGAVCYAGSSYVAVSSASYSVLAQ